MFNEKGQVGHAAVRDPRRPALRGRERLVHRQQDLRQRLAVADRASKLPRRQQPFEQAKMNADVDWLKELYGSQGYVFADIQAEPIFLGGAGQARRACTTSTKASAGASATSSSTSTARIRTRRSQTALNRLSIRSGEIVDIREIQASERRLQASGLFLTDPVRGVMPKITYHIPELEDTELASGEGRPGFRGQSPDGRSAEPRRAAGHSFVQAPGVPRLALMPARLAAPTSSQPQSGPPLIPPPVTLPSAVGDASSQTALFAYSRPLASCPADDAIDVDIYLPRPVEQPDTASVPDARMSPDCGASRSAAAAVYDDVTPPASHHQPHARRTPMPSGSRPTYQAYSSRTRHAPARIATQPVRRTQSPYQPPATPSARRACLPAAATTSTPAPRQPRATDRYAAAAYGGQTVGATGPELDRRPAATPYAVRQAAITEPQFRRAHGRRCRSRPHRRPQYRPPPSASAAAPPAAVTARRPCTGPAPVLAPDPNITPVAAAADQSAAASPYHAVRSVHADVHRPGGRYGRRAERSANRPARCSASP